MLSYIPINRWMHRWFIAFTKDSGQLSGSSFHWNVPFIDNIPKWNVCHLNDFPHIQIYTSLNLLHPSPCGTGYGIVVCCTAVRQSYCLYTHLYYLLFNHVQCTGPAANISFLVSKICQPSNIKHWHTNGIGDIYSNTMRSRKLRPQTK